MTEQKKTIDPRVEAIRNDPAVGRGSCSSLDECCDDADLTYRLDRASIIAPKDAVIWARKMEHVWLERGCDQRWGDDDDPQPKALKEFETMCKENPVEP